MRYSVCVLTGMGYVLCSSGHDYLPRKRRLVVGKGLQKFDVDESRLQLFRPDLSNREMEENNTSLWKMFPKLVIRRPDLTALFRHITCSRDWGLRKAYFQLIYVDSACPIAICLCGKRRTKGHMGRQIASGVIQSHMHQFCTLILLIIPQAEWSLFTSFYSWPWLKPLLFQK